LVGLLWERVLLLLLLLRVLVLLPVLAQQPQGRLPRVLRPAPPAQLAQQPAVLPSSSETS